MYACLHFVRIYSASFRVEIQKFAAVSHSNSLWKCVAQNTAVAVCETFLVDPPLGLYQKGSLA